MWADGRDKTAGGRVPQLPEAADRHRGREPAASDGRDDADEQMQGRPGRGDHQADPPVPACPTGKNEQHPLPVQLWLYGLFACRKMNGLMVLEDLRC